jgi:hypothetical protein
LILKPLAASLLVLLATISHALAWGYDGHRIIADIAEQYLEPAAARHVRELLALENETTLAEVANWADRIRGQRRETAPWHFVDIPIHPAPGTPAAYDQARDCPGDNCVVAKIDQFTAELRDHRLAPRQRLEALKFVVHFIGDLHQPLHASDNGDRGGNAIRVRLDGRDTNLHAVWDSGILDPAVGGDDRGYALRLAQSISPAELKLWQGGSAVDWANESHAIAVRVIYGSLSHAGSLPASYENAALPVVNRQLERAGVRLAAVLNGALSSEETTNK